MDKKKKKKKKNRKKEKQKYAPLTFNSHPLLYVALKYSTGKRKDKT